MAFNFMAAVGGAAKRASERLKTLETDTKELVKTEAGRIADEIATTRKNRIKARLDYGKAARKLKTNYNLSDGQIETVLAGGIENADAFGNKIMNMEAKALLAHKKSGDMGDFNFDSIAAGQSLFNIENADAPARTITEQQDLYAATISPFTNDLINEATQRISGQISSQVRGGAAPTDYISETLNRNIKSLAQMPKGDIKGTFGDTGIGLTAPLTGMSVADTLALQQAAQAAEAGEIELDIKKGTKKDVISLANTNAEIAKQKKIELENSNNFFKKTEDKRAQELKLKLDQMTANINLTQAQRELAIQKGKAAKINLSIVKEFGKKEKEAALNLLHAKIAEVGSPATFEELSVDTARRINEINSEINALDRNNPANATAIKEKVDEIQLLETLLVDTGALIASQAEAENAGKVTNSIFSKINPDKVFNSTLKRNSNTFGLDANITSLGEFTVQIKEGKMPNYVTAVKASLDEFQQRYANTQGTYNQQGADFVRAASKTLTDSIVAFTKTEDYNENFSNHSTMEIREVTTTPTPGGPEVTTFERVKLDEPRTFTMEEITRFEEQGVGPDGATLKPGDTITVAQGDQRFIFMYNTANEFITGSSLR